MFMLAKLRSYVGRYHFVTKAVAHTEHVAHIGYFGAISFGFHEFYGYAAGVLLFVFLFNAVMGEGDV